MFPQCPAVSLEQLKACARKNERSRTDAGFGGDKPIFPRRYFFMMSWQCCACYISSMNRGRRIYERAVRACQSARGQGGGAER